jgi:hypothetical protein
MLWSNKELPWGKLLYHNPRTPAFSPTDHRETQRASVTFEVRVGTRSDRVGPQGRTVPAGYSARTAHHRLKPMKHDLTLDQVKQEARQLLRGLQRRDPDALRRYRAVDPFTDMSNPALDHARHIIAREHGFSSWRKLKEHIDNLGR